MPESSTSSKACPFCRELIRIEATKCRYCGEWFEDGELSNVDAPPISPTTRTKPVLTEKRDPRSADDSYPDSTSSGEPQVGITDISEDEAHQWKKTSKSYFLQHFRGEHSLAHAYWINGVGITIGIVFFSSVAAVFLQDIDLRLAAAIGIFLVFFGFAVSIWQYIGIYRSSCHHVRRGGTRFWANIAQFMLAIMLLRMGVSMFEAAPALKDYGSVLMGDSRLPSYSITILSGGREIEFRGGLRAGAANQLKRVLDKNASVRRLRINSSGGRLNEGLAMAKLVRDRQLNTYSSDLCESAATLPFLVGTERIIEGRTKLGFHRPSLPSYADPQQQRVVQQKIRLLMEEAGLSTKFISQVLQTSSGTMWHPSLSELESENVVTRVSFEHVERILASYPVYDAMKALAPAYYSEMLAELASAMRSKNVEAEVFNVTTRRVDGLMSRVLPSTSNSALLAVVRNWVGLLAFLKEKDSATALSLVSGKPSKNAYSLLRSIPSDFRSNSLAVAELVFRSAKSDTVRDVKEVEAAKDLESVHETLRRRFGKNFELLGEQEQWPESPAIVCDLLHELYVEILKLPPERASQLIRYLISDKP